MSLTASVPNTFGTVTGTAKTGDLDTNYTSLVTFLNDPRSKVAFIDDTGTANAVVLALSPVIVGALASNPYVTVWFKAGANNTGAANCTLNGTTKNVKKVNPQTQAFVDLTKGDIVIGAVYGVVYQAAADVFLIINPSAPIPLSYVTTVTTAALASGAFETQTITHGLGSDDVEVAVFGINNTSGFAGVWSAGIVLVDGKNLGIKGYGAGTTNTLSSSSVAAGTVRVDLYNNYAVGTSTITAKIIVRRLSW